MKSCCAIAVLMLFVGPTLAQNTAMATGACCYDTWQGQGCIEASESDCEVILDGLWSEDVTCWESNCRGACCLNNECMIMRNTDCLGLGGTFNGLGTTCNGDSCQPPAQGACCHADDVSFGHECMQAYEVDCISMGGSYQGDFTTCETSCGCPGDLNNDQSIGVDDLLIVLSEYGLSCTDGCVSDFDESGNVNIDDLLTMLSYYGMPCS
ncbi:MAG: hypothetical protein MK089_07885 [Phycisphaerales bacterium]|nr:hypothetical protein [Phycisphaerales bacterium]